jgi:hypothetical protein
MSSKNKEYCSKMLLKDTNENLNADFISMANYVRCLKINNPEKDKKEREKRYTMRDLFLNMIKGDDGGFPIR